MKSQSEENPDFLHNAEQILGITAQRFFQPWIQPAMLFRLSKYAKPYYHAVDVLNKLLQEVIPPSCFHRFPTHKINPFDISHLLNGLKQLYDSKKVEHAEAMAQNKLQAEDLANNNDVIDEKPVEKTIFIDRIVKLALEDKVFTEQNVLDELKTVLLAVSITVHFFSFSYLMHRNP